MVLRARLHLPDDLFPVDAWSVESHVYTGEFVHAGETIFALANGFLGIRGSHEEGLPAFEPGIYLNGFYELRPIVYGEKAYGFPEVGQTMLNCPDGRTLKLYVDDEPFDVRGREVENYARRLDLERGLMVRRLTWRHPNGKRIHYETTRLVSFTNRHCAMLHARLRVEGAAASVTFASEIGRTEPMSGALDPEDPRLGAQLGRGALTPLGGERAGTRGVLSYGTQKSGARVACGMEHVLTTDCPWQMAESGDDDGVQVVFRIDAAADSPVELTKFLAYHHSRHRSADELRRQVGWTLDSAKAAGVDELCGRQREAVADFWSRADVVVLDDDTRTQQVLRWNLYQLLQASACVDGAGIGARGLTGQTYEGHYFWDTEVYVLPFLIYTNPRIARSLLKFRYDKLDKARRRARELGHRGALFPWRTISGDEASAYYAASTAQYHINADIVYALRKYVDITGDVAFLHDYGAEILVETARLWVSLGYYNFHRSGQFCIAGVTGPDEYTAIVNNNYFTNLMARENLRYAAAIVRRLAAENPVAHARLIRATELEDEEVEEWGRAADAMFLPNDAKLGIHLQDDSFIDKPIWDFMRTPPDHYPLLLYYHPLNLYRHQVIKQADIILAMFLLGHEFTLEEKRRNFDYYDPLTTHDSSLSVCVQSIIANEIGEHDKALEYFHFAATMDLSDVGGNVKNGAHIASIGGTWLALVYGFGGLRDWQGELRFEPRLPAAWRGLRFHLEARGSRLHVEAMHDRTSYTLLSGPPLDLVHRDQPVRLTPDAPTVEIATSTPPTT